MVEENEKMLKVENEVANKPTATGGSLAVPIQVLSRSDDS